MVVSTRTSLSSGLAKRPSGGSRPRVSPRVKRDAEREADRKRYQGRARYYPNRCSDSECVDLRLFGEPRPPVLGGVKPRGRRSRS